MIDGRVTQGRPQLPILIEGNGNSLVGTVALQGHGWEYQRDNVYKLDRQVFGQTNVWVAGQPLPRVEGADWTSMLNDRQNRGLAFGIKPFTTRLSQVSIQATSNGDRKAPFGYLPLPREPHRDPKSVHRCFAFDGIQIGDRWKVSGSKTAISAPTLVPVWPPLTARKCKSNHHLSKRNAKAGIISDRLISWHLMRSQHSRFGQANHPRSDR